MKRDWFGFDPASIPSKLCVKDYNIAVIVAQREVKRVQAKPMIANSGALQTELNR